MKFFILQKPNAISFKTVSKMTNSSYLNQTGGLEFFFSYISDFLPYVILVSFGALAGVIGILKVYKT